MNLFFLFHAHKFSWKSTFLKILSLHVTFSTQMTNSRNNQFMENILTNHAIRGLQRDVVYLGWPIAPSYMSPNAGGGKEWPGFSQRVQLYTWSPNKLWRSNSIFNLYMPYKKKCLFQLFYVYFLKTNDKNIFSSAVRAPYYFTRIIQLICYYK